MPKPLIKIHNLETGEEVEREMTTAELKEYEADQAVNAQFKVEYDAKATAKADLLDRLGITAEEAQLLLS
jgi:hypothetical protein